MGLLPICTPPQCFNIHTPCSACKIAFGRFLFRDLRAEDGNASKQPRSKK